MMIQQWGGSAAQSLVTCVRRCRSLLTQSESASGLVGGERALLTTLVDEIVDPSAHDPSGDKVIDRCLVIQWIVRLELLCAVRKGRFLIGLSSVGGLRILFPDCRL
jgi:hypothetical protein